MEDLRKAIKEVKKVLFEHGMPEWDNEARGGYVRIGLRFPNWKEADGSFTIRKLQRALRCEGLEMKHDTTWGGRCPRIVYYLYCIRTRAVCKLIFFE